MPLYTPLPKPIDGDEEDVSVRLVKLSPAGDTDKVSCNFVTCSLKDPIPYEALSYCWGNEDNMAEITCDGYPIKIRSNLHDFLLRTRAKGTERTLWIDALCINQLDLEEKGLQVKAMRYIYKRARRTLIWLGKEDQHGTIGLDFAQEMSAKFQGIKPRGADGNEKEEPKLPWYRFKYYEMFSRVWAPQWGAFFGIFDREWFTRVWIIQE